MDALIFLVLAVTIIPVTVWALGLLDAGARRRVVLNEQKMGLYRAWKRARYGRGRMVTIEPPRE